ncbi:alpha/beta hydrolase family protein [Alkalicoccobacillus murimartini]|uniref:Esterase n=1 Tax=Alkalicoccobacillus murimartini TaxID=171685 RepID=A0ABT9YKU1_9BACI|nr:alpha/beta hydrolase family protein [Alkalicoccobacillus murimartini]MDQ0208487.1 putative esterase [Alkalicoccobacillus murimartini]
MLEPDLFFEKLSENHKTVIDPTDVRKQLHEKLGKTPLESMDLDIQKLETTECIGYTRERFVFQASEDLIVPVYVLTPHSTATSFSSVLALHGHGKGSRELVGLLEDGSEDQTEPGIHQHAAVQLVKKGMKVFVPEILGFGDRKLKRDKEKTNSCFAMASTLLMAGSTLVGVRVFEAKRTLDMMATFHDVKQDQIGLFGFSGGGLVAGLTSVLDQRVAATVLSGFTNTFKHSILAMDHCIDNYIPDILSVAELPELIGLISPRKLFIEAGDEDRIFPIDGVREAVSRLETIYETNQVSQNLVIDVFQGGHTISGRHSFDWLQIELKRQ